MSSSNILATEASRMKRALLEIFYGKTEGVRTFEVVVVDRSIILK